MILVKKPFPFSSPTLIPFHTLRIPFHTHRIHIHTYSHTHFHTHMLVSSTQHSPFIVRSWFNTIIIPVRKLQTRQRTHRRRQNRQNQPNRPQDPKNPPNGKDSYPSQQQDKDENKTPNSMNQQPPLLHSFSRIFGATPLPEDRPPQQERVPTHTITLLQDPNSKWTFSFWRRIFTQVWHDYRQTWEGVFFFPHTNSSNSTPPIETHSHTIVQENHTNTNTNTDTKRNANTNTDTNTNTNTSQQQFMEQIQMHQDIIQQNLQQNITTLQQSSQELLQYTKDTTGIQTKTDFKRWVMDQMQLINQMVQEFMKGYRQAREEELQRTVQEYFQDLDAQHNNTAAATTTSTTTTNTTNTAEEEREEVKNETKDRFSSSDMILQSSSQSILPKPTTRRRKSTTRLDSWIHSLSQEHKHKPIQL